MDEQQCPPGSTGRLIWEQHHNYTEDNDEHRYRQKRPNLAEASGHVMGGEDHQVTGDVRSKESAERQKSDHIDRTRCCAQDGWQQPVRCFKWLQKHIRTPLWF